MTVLTPTDLAVLRQQARRMMTSQATILRLTRGPDGAGGFLETWNAIGTVPCRVLPLSGRERLLAEQVAHVGDVRIWFPLGTDIRAEDRITVGSSTFEVTGVVPQGDDPILIEVTARTL